MSRYVLMMLKARDQQNFNFSLKIYTAVKILKQLTIKVVHLTKKFS